MAADVTVRLTAEGHQDILLALDQIAAKSRSTGAVAKSSFEGMGLSMSNVRNLLAQLGVAFSIGALAGFVTRTIQSTEELGRLSQGLGASIQNVSLLGYQARLLDTDVSQLSMRLTRFARTSEDAANGVGSAVHIFRDLGLSLGEIQAFKAQDTVERLAVVAEHMAKMQDGPAKTALAFQLFGRNAQAMIPLLNELATKGLAGIRKEMEDLGVMIRDQDVRALTPLHEQLRNLAIQGEALGRTFAVRVAPALTDAFAAISRQVSSSKKDMEDWGSTVRDVFKSVLLPAILIIDTIATYNRALISLIVDVNKLSGDVLSK